MKGFVKFVAAGCVMTGAVAFSSMNAVAQPDTGTPTTAPSANAEMVDSPFYKAWSNFGKGSSATYKMTMNQGGMEVNATVTQTLEEMAAEKATVKTHTVVNFMGQTNEQDQTDSVPAKAEKGKEWMMPGGKAPLKEAGQETITVAGKSYNCKKLTIDHTENGENAKGTAFYSEEVPGGLVKMDIDATTQMGVMKIAMELQSTDKK